MVFHTFFFSFLRRCSIGLTAKTQRCGTHVPKICPREYQFYFAVPLMELCTKIKFSHHLLYHLINADVSKSFFLTFKFPSSKQGDAVQLCPTSHGGACLCTVAREEGVLVRGHSWPPAGEGWTQPRCEGGRLGVSDVWRSNEPEPLQK